MSFATKIQYPTDHIISDDLVLPPRYSIRLYYTSLVNLLIFPIACYTSRIDFPCMVGVLGLTSINYWRHPVKNNWRRTLDRWCVFICTMYHLICISPQVPQPYWFFYWMYTLMSVRSYIYAWYYGNIMEDYDMSSRYHVLLHCFSHGGNMLAMTTLFPDKT
jgi:hypothetical protein